MENSKGLPFLTRKMLAFEEGAEMTLQIKTVSANQNTVSIRGMTKEGPFVLKHITGIAKAAKTESFRMPDVPILLCVDDINLNFSRGDLYVELSFLVNGVKIYQFGAGYVYGGNGLAWPESYRETNSPVRGNLLVTSSANPAAGTPVQITLGNDEMWKINAIHFTLVTAATVAVRTVNIIFEVNSIAVFQINSTTTQLAGLTRKYSFVAGGGASGATLVNDIYVPLPSDIYLPENSNIYVMVDNLQAADDLSAIDVYIEKYRTEFGA